MTTLHVRRTALLIGFCLPFGATSMLAQRTPPAPPDPRPMPAPAPRAQRYINGLSFRSGGLLGVTLRASSGPADTLGILIESVQDGMPAEKAGIRDGARIMSIDGIDLRLEPRDIGDSAAERLPESRLRRAISAKAPGDSVTLEVRQEGRTDTKRVTLAETPGLRLFTTAMSASPRRMLGVGFAQRGSLRDTAGLLVTSLTEGGAGETAGLMEGDRIVSVDGTDLRVRAADAGSPEGVEASISRLRRALDASKDSQPVRLEVLTEGRRRTMSVTPSREMRWNGFSISPERLQGMAADIRAGVGRNFALSDDDRLEIERARSEGLRDRDDAIRESRREIARARIEIERSARDVRRMRIDDGDEDAEVRMERRSDDRRGGGILRGRTDGAMLSLDGLSLASVDRDFAQQLGKGAERGALVVRTRDTWEPLRAGDVILSIEGRPLRDGDALDVTIDRSRDQRLEILRNGKKETLTLRSAR